MSSEAWTKKSGAGKHHEEHGARATNACCLRGQPVGQHRYKWKVLYMLSACTVQQRNLGRGPGVACVQQSVKEHMCHSLSFSSLFFSRFQVTNFFVSLSIFILPLHSVCLFRRLFPHNLKYTPWTKDYTGNKVYLPRTDRNTLPFC